MAEKQPTPAARVKRRAGPLVAVGALLTVGAFVFAGCVGAGPSNEAGALTGGPSRAPADAHFLPSAESTLCLSATDPGLDCGGGPDVSLPPAAASLPAAPTAAPSPSEVPVALAAAPLVVTIADDGTTLHLMVGQQFLLDLGSGSNWSAKVGSEQVVRRVTGVALPVGSQGLFEARAIGTTFVSAIGVPPCTSGDCAMFRLGFDVTITVS